MKHSLKIIILSLITIAFFSCSDEFVNEKLNVAGVATSAIIISPVWDADDYQFTCMGVEDADFSIVSKPDWLNVESNSGQFAAGIATIHCSANTEPLFSKIGFYIDQMVITSGKRQYAIPLYYVTEGNPSIQVNREYRVGNSLQILNSGDGILVWDIVSMPNWLLVDMNQLDLRSVILGHGISTSIPFYLDAEPTAQGVLNGTVILKTNDKNNPIVEIAVVAYLGTPRISLVKELVDFGSYETSKTFGIFNNGDRVLSWNFEELPKWLSVSPASGKYGPHSYSSDVIFTCDRSKLQTGINSATIKLKSNDPDNPSMPIVVTARVPGINPNTRALEGNIVNATFDKNTNLLYYITSQPDKLVAYDVATRTVLNEVALSKAPTCLAINEDFKQALIGHNGMTSIVDLTSYTVTKTYQMNSTVHDIEWGEGDWFCYTLANSTNSNLPWINLSTDETYESVNNYSSFGTADLNKVPGQPYIIASSTLYTPTGIFVFDINSKTLKSFSHESIGNVWFFEGGETMVTEYSDIILTSVVTTINGDNIYSPSTLGKFQVGTYPQGTWWADCSKATQSIWVIMSYNRYIYRPPVESTFYQFNDSDYTLMKAYTYDKLYLPNAQATEYEVQARYIFANSSGTELSVLRKGKDNNNWSVEFITVQ